MTKQERYRLRAVIMFGVGTYKKVITDEVDHLIQIGGVNPKNRQKALVVFSNELAKFYEGMGRFYKKERGGVNGFN